MAKASLSVVGESEFKIESGIAVPVPKSGRRKYPFGEMNIGDSIFVPPEHRQTIGAAAHYYGKTHKKVFTIHKVEGGYRLWRVS